MQTMLRTHELVRVKLLAHLVCCRDNVLFGHAFDEERYCEVLRACALEQDVQQMHDSDLTHVGDRGAALSGGQQARLALARAVYQVSGFESNRRNLAYLSWRTSPRSTYMSRAGFNFCTKCRCDLMTCKNLSGSSAASLDFI